MNLFIIITLLVIISAFYSYINARFVKLPATIGIMFIATAVSVLIIVVDKVHPSVADFLTRLAKSIDFSEAVLNIMLGFLLFAGSFNFDTNKLKREMRSVMVLSTLSVIISTFIFGGLFFLITGLLGIKIPLIYCLLFGSLVSPTDAVAVAGIVKGSKLSSHLEVLIAGESLFNDGVGLVLFTTILEIAYRNEDAFNLGKTALLFLREVFGGVGFGLMVGFAVNKLMRSITDFQTIVLLSIGTVMGISVACIYWKLSIPLAVVSAGLFIGTKSINASRDETSHQSLERFWKLIDEMLNTILFVLIGLQMVTLPFITNFWLTGSIAIVLVLVARWLSIAFPLTFLRRSLKVNYHNINVLTWAGIRGGISIALALSLPHNKYRYIILSSCYFIVIFSVIVQGLTLNRLINSRYNDESTS
ncbi:sodium:proton antiporter [Mucilaginibacter sp. RS28]|uniref:Sodium:proton antiporter n=1 Tax=Mucilaginibacter straminoryzae TaxID=2932774 RepID=A0A9X2BA88_9SPHI|nr:sodium:proton antiporter [Mucilaginibacter straminoryzae]MCJ8211559.1 sodium:proton antiporter [Mucilaginibacter straminoryzae]